jgi:hypothetical protein
VLIYPLIQGRDPGSPAWWLVWLGAGIALLGAFGVYESRRRTASLIEKRLKQDRNFTSGLALALGFFDPVGGLLLVLSLFCQIGQGSPPSKQASR